MSLPTPLHGSGTQKLEGVCLPLKHIGKPMKEYKLEKADQLHASERSLCVPWKRLKLGSEVTV